MPFFRIVFDEGAVPESVEPVEFPDHESAIDAVKQAARETMAETLLESCDPTTWVARIYNEHSDLISTIFASDVLKDRLN